MWVKYPNALSSTASPLSNLTFTIFLSLSLLPLSDTTGVCKETKAGEVYEHVLTRLTD